MADYRFAYNGPTQNIAKAMLRDAPISTKVAIEISSHLRGKDTAKAKRILKSVLKYEQAIPFKRFTDGVGHRKGPMSSGRFPQKASEAFLKLIESAENNASQNSMSTDLVIKHLMAQKASSPWRFGRQRRRKMKRTHVEIVLAQSPTKKEKPAKKASIKKETPKAPAKKEAVKSQKSEAKPATKQATPEAAADKSKQPAKVAPTKKQETKSEDKK